MNNSKLKMGGMAAAVTAIVIVAVILLNLLAGMLTERFFLKADLTSTGLYKISEDSVKILGDLPGDATLYLLISEMEAPNMLQEFGLTLNLVELLGKYASYSRGRVSLQYMDPTLNPNLSDRFGVGKVAKGDLIVQGPSRSKLIALADLFSFSESGSLLGYRVEQELTSAVLYVMAEKVPGVAFTGGHGEITYVQSSNGTSLSMLWDMFDKSGFAPYGVSLSTGDFSEGTHAVVIAAPQTDFTDDEINKLDAFAKGGGSVMYLADRERLPNLTAWLEEWGLQVTDNVILDETSRFGGDPRLVIPLVNACDMFNSVGTSGQPMVQLPREIKPLFAERGNLTTESVLGTSKDSYARGLDSENSAIARADDDPAGPFTIGAVTTYRVYDSATGMPSDSYITVLPFSLCVDGILGYYMYLNNDLTGAAVRYLTPSDAASGLVVPSRALPNYIMRLTGLPSIMVSIFLIGVVPLAIFVTGFVLWFRRRKS